MEGEGRSVGHRQLVPDLGRFISRDPIGFNGGLNLFNGHGASPVTMVDPTGLQYGGSHGYYTRITTGEFNPDPNSFPAIEPWIDMDGWNRVFGQFGDFLDGIPMESDFGPNTQACKDMQTDTGRINRGLNDWVKKNKARKPGTPLIPTKYFPDDDGYTVKNWGAHGGAFQAGINPTLQFVGGYHMNFIPQSNGMLKIDIVNETSNKSLFYDCPRVEAGPLKFGPKQNPYGPNGPRHTQTQHYYWYVPMPSLK